MISVKKNDKYGFVPKAGKERNIPVPNALWAELVARKGEGLIFGTKNNTPNQRLYNMLQDVAEKAGVENSYPHKFRATYVTRCHDAKVPVRTIMSRDGLQPAWLQPCATSERL